MLIRQLAKHAAAQPPFFSRGICLEARLKQTQARLYLRLRPTLMHAGAQTKHMLYTLKMCYPPEALGQLGGRKCQVTESD